MDKLNQLLFLHIPKTAGTSINEDLQPYLKYQFGHVTAQEYIERGFDLKNIFTFTFVRNPYDRFVSLFFYSIF